MHFKFVFVVCHILGCSYIMSYNHFEIESMFGSYVFIFDDLQNIKESTYILVRMEEFWSS